MKILLRNFRKYKEINLNFENGKTLLSGSSGAGKTTILNAILWILFGGMKNVENPENKKTYGELLLNNVKIIRSKHPKTLEVIVDNTIYSGEIIGQNKINDIFGNKITWLTTSYISQGNRNYLLTTSNNERFDILKSILFNENTNLYLDKISDKIIESNKQLEKLKYIYDIDNNNFKESYKASNINLKNVNIKNLSLLNNKLHQLNEVFQSLISNKSLNDKLKIKKSLLSSELAQINIELETLPSSFDVLQHEQSVNQYKLFMINNISKELYDSVTNSVDDIIKSKQKLNYLQSYISSIKIYDLPHIDISQEDIDEIKEFEIISKKINDLPIIEGSFSLEEAINQQNLKHTLNNFKPPKYNFEYTKNYDLSSVKDKLKQLLLKQDKRTEQIKKIQKYDKKLVDERIKLIQHILNNQDNIKILKRRNELESYIKSHPIEDNLDNKIIEIREKILSSNSLICPCCNSFLLYKNNELVSINVKSKSSLDINFLQSRLNELEKMLKYSNTLDMYNYELNNLPQINIDITNVSLLNQEQIIKLNKELYVLQNIEWIDDVSTDIIFYSTLENDIQYNLIHNKIIKNYPTPDQVYSINERNELISSLKQPRIKNISYSQALDIYNNNKNRIIVDKSKSESSSIIKSSPYINLSQEALFYIKNNKWVDIDTNLLNIDFHSLKEQKYHYDNLIKRKKSILSELNDIVVDEDLDTNINKLEKNISTIKSKIYDTSTYIKFFDIKNKLINDKTLINNLETKISKFVELKSIALKLENDILHNAINTLNNLLYENCSKMFEEPISIRLELLKNNKASISINIFYKGLDYDISMLSGGEMDRISLGLTLAFNEISSSNILMLDECLSSLDSRNKENALKCLNSQRMIIVCDHEAVEGYYEHVINIE